MVVNVHAMQIAKKLRALPSVETSLPTLALVGAPNVGKSSLVRVSVSFCQMKCYVWQIAWAFKGLLRLGTPAAPLLYFAMV